VKGRQVELDLGLLGSDELKKLSVAVKAERERRGRKNPANHDPPKWPVPKKALKNGQQAA